MKFEDIVMSQPKAQSFLAKHLQSEGYVVCVQCNFDDVPDHCEKCLYKDKGYESKQHGIDIVAREDHECLIMEVKGSDYKEPAAYRTGFWTLLGQIFLDMKKFDDDISFAIGLPYHRNYRSFLFERFAKSKAVEKLGLRLMLIVEKQEKLDVLKIRP